MRGRDALEVAIGGVEQLRVEHSQTMNKHRCRIVLCICAQQRSRSDVDTGNLCFLRFLRCRYSIHSYIHLSGDVIHFVARRPC